MRRLVEQGWEEYRRRVIGPGASETQLLETRKGFYAGASVVFFLLKQRLGEQDNPPAEDEAFLDEMLAELEAFADQVEDEHRAIASPRGRPS